MPEFTAGLKTPVRYIKGAGPKISKLFERMGVSTVEDLLYFLPRSYEDRSLIAPISTLRPDQEVLIKGRVVKAKAERTRRGFSLFKAVIQDESGSVVAVWFNQAFLDKVIKKDKVLYIAGKAIYNNYSGSLELNVKNYDFYDEAQNEQIIPIYPLTEGLYQKKLRKIIRTALEKYLNVVREFFPQKLIDQHKLTDLPQALQTLHLPSDLSQIENARRRIIFDDLFIFQLGLGMRSSFLKKRQAGSVFKVEGDLISRFMDALPFELTGAQKKVFAEIKQDLLSGHAMNRLLQGDVGSGKTILAVLTAVLAHRNGLQTAMMAPTEILARQHMAKVSQFLDGLGFKVVLLVGSLSNKEKKVAYKIIENGEADLVIGTHALIEEGVKFKNLGLVIVDEQQRFGVMQRARLAKKGKASHVLVMTATPIPRSLALTLYGDLDKSIIDELPPGRTPVQTHFVTEAKRQSAYDFIKKEIRAGRQVYVVCPLVQESEKLDLKAAKEEAMYLQSQVFKEFKVALIHGKVKANEKDRIMRDFLDKKINILVSTTVIEVGIDVPNAAVMLIEHVERFGLSALHQLRGRIGRGAAQSYCFLCGNPKTPEAKSRVKAMLSTNDGFKIAEVDLKLRGPGEFYGEKQSGLPEFRLADIIRDEPILLKARAAAFNLLKNDPSLSQTENIPLKAEVLRRYKKYLNLGILN
ncbi:MAG: ATP-dependent DNA helicase RecG [Candidatus Margulisbacteria bacterium]|nr:ATP-dependent DNA helicase RecG [Candidatus Margulisiibacteriota bacterium]MBU1021497.1 ATP-dependent DNA helicase RecG [Candidatus Margulisiibacteriota bacterium]MBU1728582.1 ATP-dependent DNA helicase RecG [Candidatus Margulisiibacteriota bacterium]MBU1955839.1 ATP-dependent DNA helicase RecG [Candidatus Margulisiibacteriota bacterium]